jgi:hypothetical protein
MDSIDEMLMIKDMTPEIFYGLGGGNSGLEDNMVKHNMGDVALSEDRIKNMMKGGRKEPAGQSDTATGDFKIGREKSRALGDYFRVYGDRKDFLNDYNRININTASYRVISALTENMTDDKVSEIIRRRLVKPYESVDEIKDIIGNDEQFETLKKYISVKSYIFRIKTVATINSTEATITAYYNRDKKSFLYWCEE